MVLNPVPMDTPNAQPQAASASTPRKKMTKQLTGKRDDTPLHSAARAGNMTVLKDTVGGTEEGELRVLLTKQNHAGETVLYVAAEYGYVDMVRELIQYYDLAGAGIKARNGFDALHIAAKQGDLGMSSMWFCRLLFFCGVILGGNLCCVFVEMP